MRWGIAFDIPATFNQDLWPLPPPSKTEQWKKMDNTKMIRVLYHFLYNPQTWKEWQRVASIKMQMKQKVRGIQFLEYQEHSFDHDSRLYDIAELGAFFKDYVKFPDSFIAGTAYKTLCIYAKRLHYEDLLSIEKLISTSLWLSDFHEELKDHSIVNQKKKRRPMVEGFRQCIKRAFAAYAFSLSHKDEWPQKLDPIKRHSVLRENALRSTAIKREKSLEKRELAKELKMLGKTHAQIAEIIGVSVSTVKRWMK